MSSSVWQHIISHMTSAPPSVTWPLLLRLSHDLCSSVCHMTSAPPSVTWPLLLRQSHDLCSSVCHMTSAPPSVTWPLLLHQSHDLCSSVSHMTAAPPSVTWPLTSAPPSVTWPLTAAPPSVTWPLLLHQSHDLWPLLLRQSHDLCSSVSHMTADICSFVSHMTSAPPSVTWPLLLRQSHDLCSSISHMISAPLSVTWPLLRRQSHDLWPLQVSHIHFYPSLHLKKHVSELRNLKVSPSFPQTACIGSAVIASRCAARQPIISSRLSQTNGLHMGQRSNTWHGAPAWSRADVRLIYGHSSVMSTGQTSDDRSLTAKQPQRHMHLTWQNSSSHSHRHRSVCVFADPLTLAQEEPLMLSLQPFIHPSSLNRISVLGNRDENKTNR